MLGGVIVNILLAIVIFIGLSWVYGDDNLPARNVSYGLHVNEMAKSIGLQEGDKILTIDQKEIEDISSIESTLVLSNPKTLQVQRGDSLFDLSIPATLSTTLAANKKKETIPFVVPRVPIIVDSVGKTAVTMDGGQFLKGDTLIAINQKEVKYRLDFENIKKKYADSIVVVSLKRGSDTINVKALINGSGQLGVFLQLPVNLFKTVHKEFSFVQAIPFGVKRTFTTLDNYVQGIKQIFTGKVNPNDSLGSLISIGNTFPSFWDWERFWTLTGVFSIILAFMNVLPIPALDGGHALFILFEMITGRKPSDKFMEYAQITGMLIMFGLMFYALGLDFWRLFK
jgi:regulator of sigma E protease